MSRAQWTDLSRRQRRREVVVTTIAVASPGRPSAAKTGLGDPQSPSPPSHDDGTPSPGVDAR